MVVELRGSGYLEIAHGCAQTSTNTATAVTGSDLDARAWRSISYSIAAYGNSIKWSVWGANQADFSDEIAVQAEATVAANATGSYSATNATYSYYRVKIVDAVADTHGSVSLYGAVRG